MSSLPPRYTLIELDGPKPVSARHNAAPEPSLWARIKNAHRISMCWFSDTWGPELLAMVVSIGCSIAIAVLDWIWSGKSLPQLKRGFTVNAIVSILATISKSAMLYVLSSCIAQIKWIWAGQPQPLHSLQTFDDASRGPLGAIYLLADRKAWSIASLGAAVTLLALAYDPLVQQSLNVLLLPIDVASPGSTIKRNVALPRLFDALTDYERQQVLWTDNFDQTPNCKADNCTWPVFETVSLCQKCQPFEANVTKHFRYTEDLPHPQPPYPDGAVWPLSINLEITVGDFGPINDSVGRLVWYSPNVTYNPFGRNPYANDTSVSLYALTAVVLDSMSIANFHSFLETDGPGNESTSSIDFLTTSRFRLLSKDFLGVKNPLLVHAYFVYEWFDHGPEIFNTTLCVLDPCLKQYRVSVVQNRPTFEWVADVFGEKYLQDVPWKNYTNQTLCWKPHGKDHILLDSNIGVGDYASSYDSNSLAFCDDNLLRDNRTDWFLGLPVREAAAMIEVSTNMSGLILLNETERKLIYRQPVGDELTRDDTNKSTPFHWDVANRTESLRDSLYPGRSDGSWNKNFWQIYDLGINKTMANIAAIYTKRALEQYGSVLSGSIVTLSPHVQVRWLWLILPWLLNICTAILLALTIWSTRKAQAPLWKTSLVTALLPLLETERQTATRGDKVSQIDKVAKSVNVVLDDYDVNGGLRLRKMPK
ncbi:hypothetical protein H2198_000714 [Neophaeococcomyces mojaviensis]|uniref:Uncharacterized protein n=1 Tax=Neophaeococcomyces mojaviensis TaxID=3383035 RepID=A0ACC3AJS3_9EURO|nr:hypothetical protein H2198_000714 [Knufia sp. JES_112]